MLRCSSDGSATRLTQEEFRLLSGLISERIGLQFPEQKRDAFAVKLGQRMAALGVPTARDYYFRLVLGGERAAEELEHLAELLANHETYFFRECAQLEAFLANLAPSLAAAARTERRPVRLLSLGCSSGEEPYSLAILEREQRTQCLDVKFEIHGADLCRGVLERAAAGVYGATSLRRLGLDPRSPAPVAEHRALAERYFEPLGESRFRLRDNVRRTVAFHRANLLNRAELDTLGQFDAILCRNVFIYFDEAALMRALDNLERCLQPHGVLLLGHSESLLGRTERFAPLWLGSGMAYRVVRP